LGNGYTDPTPPDIGRVAALQTIDYPITTSIFSAGDVNTCAIEQWSPEGGVLCWGDNTYGQLGTDWPNTLPCTALMTPCGPGSGTMLLNEPVWNAVISGGVRPTASAIAVGAGHVCAMVGLQVLCWGDNSHSQLGNGTTGGQSSTPTGVLGFCNPSCLAPIAPKY
jgi:hypothetical protein